MRIRGRVAVATLAVLLLPALGDAGDDFDLRVKEAIQNEGTAAGTAYRSAFGKESVAGFAGLGTACAKRLGGPQSDPFDLVMKLSAKGTVEKVLVHPRTRFSSCFAELTKKATFPRPPSPGYWVTVGMRFTPQK